MLGQQLARPSTSRWRLWSIQGYAGGFVKMAQKFVKNSFVHNNTFIMPISPANQPINVTTTNQPPSSSSNNFRPKQARQHQADVRTLRSRLRTRSTRPSGFARSLVLSPTRATTTWLLLPVGRSDVSATGIHQDDGFAKPATFSLDRLFRA